MSTNDITVKARRLKRLQSKAEELQNEITEMLAQDTEELKAGEYKIRFTTVTSTRFDSRAFKATHADLYNQYVKSTQSRRFSIV